MIEAERFCGNCGAGAQRREAMFCSNCGARLSDPDAGHAPAPQGGPPSPGTVGYSAPSNGMATAGFVCGLVGALAGLLPVLFFLWIPLGILGIVFGAIGRGNAARLPGGNGGGLATAGIVLGIIALILPLALCGAAVGSATVAATT